MEKFHNLMSMKHSFSILHLKGYGGRQYGEKVPALVLWIDPRIIDEKTGEPISRIRKFGFWDLRVGVQRIINLNDVKDIAQIKHFPKKHFKAFVETLKKYNHDLNGFLGVLKRGGFAEAEEIKGMMRAIRLELGNIIEGIEEGAESEQQTVGHKNHPKDSPTGQVTESLNEEQLAFHAKLDSMDFKQADGI